MLKIFVLEDEWIQQSRIESVLQELIAHKSLQCKAPEVFGKSSQLLDAITERGAHHLFFLDIEIKGEEKKVWRLQKRFVRKTPMRPLSLSPLTLNSCPLPFSTK